MIQEERVHAMRQLEVRTDMLLPNGFKEVELLKNIGEAIAKIDLGGELLRAKGMMNNVGLPPVDVVTPRTDDLAVFASFDAVDRNLARAAAEQVINIWRVREGRPGRVETGGAGETDLGGAAPD